MAAKLGDRAKLVAGVCALALMAGQGAVAQDIAVPVEATDDDRLELEPIVVEGQRDGNTFGNAEVTSEDLEATAPRNTRQVFQRQSAVTVAGGAAPSQEIYVNGLGQSNLSVTVDGARLPGNVWHHNNSFVLDPAFLKAVRVDTGVAPADAGFGAAAGAIAFETVNARDLLAPSATSGARVQAGFSTNSETLDGSLALYGLKGSFDYLAILSGADGNDYDNGDGDRQRGTEDSLQSGLVKLGYESQTGNRFEFSYEGSEDSADRPLRLNMDVVRGDFTYNRNEATRQTTTMRYTRTSPAGIWDPEVLIYFTEADLKRPNESGYTEPSGDFNAYVDLWGGKVENTFGLEMGSVVAGIDYSSYSVDIDRFHFPDNPRVSEDLQTIGAYTQARLDLTDRFAFSAGLRVDGQKYTAVDGQDFEKSGVSPNATLEYEAVEGLSFFASASRPWLGIPQAEAAVFHANDYTYAPDLKAATSENYKFGANFAYGGWSGSVNWFSTEIKNGEGYDYTTYTRINGADLTSEGFDLSVNYGWGSGRAGLNLTDADVQFGDTIVFPGSTTAAPVGTIAALFIDQEIARYDVTVGGDIQWASKVDDEDFLAAGFEEINAYTVVNLYGLWQPEQVAGLDVRFGIDNLFNENYVARGTYPNREGVVDAVEAPGRSYTVSAVMTF